MGQLHFFGPARALAGKTEAWARQGALAPGLDLLELRDAQGVADLRDVDAAFVVHAEAVADGQGPLAGAFVAKIAGDRLAAGWRYPLPPRGNAGAAWRDTPASTDLKSKLSGMNREGWYY